MFRENGKRRTEQGARSKENSRNENARSGKVQNCEIAQMRKFRDGIPHNLDYIYPGNI